MTIVLSNGTSNKKRRTAYHGVCDVPTLIEPDYVDDEDHHQHRDHSSSLPLKKRARAAVAASKMTPKKANKKTTKSETEVNTKAMDLLLLAIDAVHGESSSHHLATPSQEEQEEGQDQDDTDKVMVVDRVPSYNNCPSSRTSSAQNSTSSSTNSVAGSMSMSSSPSPYPLSSSSTTVSLPSSSLCPIPSMSHGLIRNDHNQSRSRPFPRPVLPPLASCKPLRAPPGLPTFLRPGQVMVRATPNGPQQLQQQKVLGPLSTKLM